MQQLFGLPITIIALGLAVAVGVLLLALALVGWRAPLLWKLGARNIGRRRLRAVLIVGGLMLSTTVIGSALTTGDSITYTLHTLVAGSLGTVDEVVVLNPPRNRLRQQVQALIEPGFGGLAAAGLEFFAQREFDQLSAASGSSAAIAGLAPAIIDQATVVYGASQQLQSAMPLLAVTFPNGAQDAFGPLLTADKQRIELTSLAQDEVVINAAAVDALRARVGQPLTILRNGDPWNARIRAVTQNGSVGGNQPLILVPLPTYQRVVNRSGEINAVLVVNRGGVASVAQTAEAARALRRVLVNRTAAQQLQALLARPDMQRALRQVEGVAPGHDRPRIAALRTEAARPVLTDEFISLVSDPRIRTRLLALTGRLPSGATGASAYTLLRDVTNLSVLQIKQDVLDQAAEYGAVITTMFLALGIFSFAASILLIFLIFALLAADRGAELATMRAIGMRRRQIVGMFLFEGIVYDLLGAALGTLMSLSTGYLIVRALGQALAGTGVQLQPYVAPRSIGLTFVSGVALIFGAMLLAAWRVSHTNIVAGARGEAVDEDARWQFGGGIAALLVAGAVWWLWRASAPSATIPPPLTTPIIGSLLILGATNCILAGLRSYTVRVGPLLVRGLTALAGLAITGIWLRLLQPAVPDGDVARSAITIAVAGVVLIVAITWTAIQAVGPLLKLLDWSLRGLARVRAVVRPAAGYLGQQRGRTGLTVVMFSLIVLIMVAALTLINVAVNAYGGTEPPVAGYDLRADLQSGAALNDIEAALAKAPAVSRAAFGAIGGVVRQDAAIVQLGLPRASWQDTTLVIADDSFLRGVQARVDQRANGYGNNAAVWAGLREQPGTAIVTGRLPDGVTIPSSANATLPSLTIWARPASGGTPIKLTVIGVVDARSELDPGIYVSQATAQALGVALPAPQTYFFAVQPNVRLNDAADGLRFSFGAQGWSVTILGEILRIVQAVRLLLVRLVQGFLGLGLIAGIAALALLSVQAVLERRQQLGTLRALGFTRWQMRATLACESAVIAGLGITLGVALGLMLARSLVAVLAIRNPELHATIPWREIAVTVGIAWLGANLALLLSAWQAGRVAPADALRTT